MSGSLDLRANRAMLKAKSNELGERRRETKEEREEGKRREGREGGRERGRE